MSPHPGTGRWAPVLMLTARDGMCDRVQGLDVGADDLDPATKVVSRGDQTVGLTPKEFSLLEYFMRHPGEVLTRTRLLEHVWDFAFEGDSNVVDVYADESFAQVAG